MLNEMLSAEDRDRILRQAEEQLDAIAADLRGARSRDDLPGIQQEAHKLAGLAGTAGCVGVAGLARAIEAACEKPDRMLLARQFGELDAAVPEAIAALRRWRLGPSA